MESIKSSEKFDAMKKNQMTGLDNLKQRIESKQQQLQKEKQAEEEAKMMGKEGEKQRKEAAKVTVQNKHLAE